MISELSQENPTRKPFLLGNEFETENAIRFSTNDYAFEAAPRLIIGKDAEGNRTAKLRLDFKCQLKDKGVCEVSNAAGEKITLKNYPFSGSIELPVSLDRFASTREMHDWADETIDGFRHSLPFALVEAAKAHFLNAACVVGNATGVFPFAADLVDVAETTARRFGQAEKKICNIKHLRKNAPFANTKVYLAALDKAANSLRERGAPVTQENLAEEMQCNDVRTLRAWNKSFRVNFVNWKKNALPNKSGND